jgi:predicted lipoprotein
MRSPAAIALLVVMSIAATWSVRADSTAITELDRRAEHFLGAVSAFTNAPAPESLAEARQALTEVEKVWHQLPPALTNDPSRRELVRSIGSGEVGQADLSELIGASRCPVPFSRDMIRTLNVDMQGLAVLAYLLEDSGHGENDPAAVAAAFVNQPRRAAYLASTAALLKEKTALLATP